MRRPGRSEEQIAVVRRKLQSGEWLQENKERIAELVAGLRRELKRFPKPARAKFTARIVPALVMTEAVGSALTEKNRVRDLEDMISAAENFLETVVRTGVLARPVLQHYSASSEDVVKQQGRLVAETAELRRLRKNAHIAVTAHLKGLEAALHTRRRRERGQKPTADETGFFRALASHYGADLGEDPVSTPGRTFSNLVILIRAFQTGRTPEDVSRIVRAALPRSRR